MKVLVTNSSRQHADVHYWRATLGDSRLDHFTVPMGGEARFDVPTEQVAHVTSQCGVLGLTLKEEA